MNMHFMLKVQGEAFLNFCIFISEYFLCSYVYYVFLCIFVLKVYSDAFQTLYINLFIVFGCKCFKLSLFLTVRVCT